jgi:hypothetical protein
MVLEATTRAVVCGILARRKPELLPLLQAGQLSRQQARSVLDVVGSELADYGFDSSSEPTEYGLLLEGFIDEVNRVGFE